MPFPKATAVNLSEEERIGLEQLVRRHQVGQQIALRGRIILAAGQGQTNSAIAAELKVRFSILVRKVLKRGNFISVEDLKRKVLAFIEYYNCTMAKPFKWTYQGEALNA